METSSKQRGFSAFMAVLAVLVLATIGVTGYVIYNRTMPEPAASTATTSNDVSTAPAITTASDLDTALSVLNQNDPVTAYSGDSAQLSTDLQTF